MRSFSRFGGVLAGVAAAWAVSHAAWAAGAPVSQTVWVKWSDSAPVVGAKVFDHASNTLLGVTGQDGSVTVMTALGAQLRVVDPDYGQQQSMILVGAQNADGQAAAGSGSTTDELVFWFMT